MKLAANTPLAAKLAQVMFVVDANTFERHALWKEYHKAVDWETNTSAETLQLGHLDNRPVNIVMVFVKINGHTVMFVESVTQVVDYKMIDDFLEANCQPMYDNGHRIARTNATNFHHCLHAISELTGIYPNYEQVRLGEVDVEVESSKAQTAFYVELNEHPELHGTTARKLYARGWVAGVQDRIKMLRDR